MSIVEHYELQTYCFIQLILIKQNISQEQPLLLEDLLEQEKREQEKRQNIDSSGVNSNVSSTGSSLPGLMSDADFELLRADVMNSSASGTAIASPPIIQQSNLIFI